MANSLLGIHCVIPGCLSTLRKVNQWKARPCPKPKHKGKTQSQCMCPEPYQFFKFPTEVKLQKIWLERVKRPDMEINNLTRVCSLHFVEGKPTRRNYFPSVNLRSCTAEDADNEEDVEDDQKHVVKQQQQQQTSSASAKMHHHHQRGGGGETVSIVPMEMLHDEEEDEVYEGDLTISRFSYRRGGRNHDVVDDNDEDEMGNAYETTMPSNTVTITRVTTSNSNSNKTGNNNMRMDTRLSGGVKSVEKRKIVSTAALPPPRRFPTNSSQKPVQQQSTSKVRRIVQQVPEKAEDYDCPYEIDMVEDDQGEGFEVANNASHHHHHESKSGPRIKKVVSNYTGHQSEPSPQISIPRAVPVASNCNNEPSSAVVRNINIIKPKMIPILAVAPKTQQHHQVIQPLAVITQVSHSQTTAPPPLQRKTTNPPPQHLQQLKHSSSSSSSSMATPTSVVSSSSATNSVIQSSTLSGGSSSNAVFTPAAANANAITNPTTTVSQVATMPAPLATYDPTKQQLQIANPVKYIQECHARIAGLSAENETLKSRNAKLEGELQELLKSNNELRAQHQAMAMNSKRIPQVSTSNAIHVVTKQETPDEVNVSSAGNNVPPKPRIRYIIRRPMK